MKNFLQETRKWSAELPIWIPGFRGVFTYGDIRVEGEDGSNPGEPANPIEPPEPGEPPIGGGNILSRLFRSSSYLKFFFMGMVSYNSHKFWAQLDGYEGTVGNSVYFKFNNSEVVRLTYRAALMRFLAGYSLYERENRSQSRRYNFYGYIGARLHYADLYSDLNRLIDRLDLSLYWGEPILGLQNRLTLEKWFFILQADVGSFYRGRNYSFMIQFIGYYRISNLISLKFGWTDWDVNHKREIRNETLILNVHLSGPTSGLTFHF
ncbi:MAG: hypothetical protein JSW33_10145 [bacterium]|nr:MAG: hypothetical protein JSW33_10145 [bacterium]